LGAHTTIISTLQFVVDFKCIAAFWNQITSKSKVQIWTKFLSFLTPHKIRGAADELSQSYGQSSRSSGTFKISDI